MQCSAVGAVESSMGSGKKRNSSDIDQTHDTQQSIAPAAWRAHTPSRSFILSRSHLSPTRCWCDGVVSTLHCTVLHVWGALLDRVETNRPKENPTKTDQQKGGQEKQRRRRVERYVLHLSHSFFVRSLLSWPFVGPLFALCQSAPVTVT